MQAGCEMRNHRWKPDSAIVERTSSSYSCSVLEPKIALTDVLHDMYF